MNCQRFEDVVNDIAREQILDASVRREALEHTSECEHCAVRLEDESAISLRLKSFADTFASTGAPARVETHLLAAFVGRAAVQSQPRGVARPRYWIAGIAAVLLVVFAFAVFRARQVAPAIEKASDNVAIQVAAPVTPASSPVAPASGQDVQIYPSIPRPRSFVVRHNRANATSITNQSKPTVNNEIATDFIPVNYGGVASLADGGRMVRVELPRSAMASFGLPVNMDRANERVKADVLLGVDGLAHAIRFVR